MSRRNALSVAGIGVAAAAAGAAASYFGTRPDAAKTTTATNLATGPVPDVTGPVVVYLQDLKTGELEILVGTTQTTIRNKALADEIARAAG